MGQSERAIDYYLEADQIDPKLAVVKQQIANHLIKEGRPLDAFPFDDDSSNSPTGSDLSL